MTIPCPQCGREQKNTSKRTADVVCLVLGFCVTKTASWAFAEVFVLHSPNHGDAEGVELPHVFENGREPKWKNSLTGCRRGEVAVEGRELMRFEFDIRPCVDLSGLYSMQLVLSGRLVPAAWAARHDGTWRMAQKTAANLPTLVWYRR